MDATQIKVTTSVLRHTSPCNADTLASVTTIGEHLFVLLPSHDKQVLKQQKEKRHRAKGMKQNETGDWGPGWGWRFSGPRWHLSAI